MQYIRLLFAPRHWWSWWKLYGAKAQSYYKSLAKIEAATCPSPKIWWIFAKKSTQVLIYLISISQKRKIWVPPIGDKNIYENKRICSTIFPHKLSIDFRARTKTTWSPASLRQPLGFPWPKRHHKARPMAVDFAGRFFFFAGAGSILFMEYDCIVLFMLLMGQSYLWILV